MRTGSRQDSPRRLLGEREQMMGIAQKVSRDFHDAVRSRGQSYFAKGRVVVTGATANEVVARVRGTAKYRVRLRLRGGKLHVTCSCPYFGPTGDPCKHLWATVLMADARGLLQAVPARPLKLVSDPPRRTTEALPETHRPPHGPGHAPGYGHVPGHGHVPNHGPNHARPGPGPGPGPGRPGVNHARSGPGMAPGTHRPAGSPQGQGRPRPKERQDRQA